MLCPFSPWKHMKQRVQSISNHLEKFCQLQWDQGSINDLLRFSPWISWSYYKMVWGPWPKTHLKSPSYLFRLPVQFFLAFWRNEACNIFLSHLGLWGHRWFLKTTEVECWVKGYSSGHCCVWMKTGKAEARALKQKSKFYHTLCISFLIHHAFYSYTRWW